MHKKENSRKFLVRRIVKFGELFVYQLTRPNIVLLVLIITTAAISVYSAGLFAHSNCYDLGECTTQGKESGDGITGDVVSEIFTNHSCGTCFYGKFVYLFLSGLIQCTIPAFALYTILLGVKILKDNVSLTIFNGGPSISAIHEENPVIPPRKMATKPMIRWIVGIVIVLYILFILGALSTMSFQTSSSYTNFMNSNSVIYSLKSSVIISGDILMCLNHIICYTIVVSFELFLLYCIDKLKYRVVAIIDSKSNLSVDEHLELVLVLNELNDYVCRNIQGWILVFIIHQCLWSVSYYIYLVEYDWNNFALLGTFWFVPFLNALVFILSIGSYNYDTYRLMNAAGGTLVERYPIVYKAHSTVNKRIRNLCKECESNEKIEDEYNIRNYNSKNHILQENNEEINIFDRERAKDFDSLQKNAKYIASHLPLITIAGIEISYTSSFFVLLVWIIFLVPSVIFSKFGMA